MSGFPSARSPSPDDLSDASKERKKDRIVRCIKQLGKQELAKTPIRHPINIRVCLLLSQNYKHLQEEYNVNIYRRDWRAQIQQAEETRIAASATACTTSSFVENETIAAKSAPNVNRSPESWRLHDDAKSLDAHQVHGTPSSAPSYSFRKPSNYSGDTTAELYLWQKRDACTDEALSDANKKKPKKMLVPWSPGTPASSFKRRPWYECVDFREYFLYVPTSGPLNKMTCVDDDEASESTPNDMMTPLKHLVQSRLRKRNAAHNAFDAAFNAQWTAMVEAREQADKQRMKRHDSAISLSPPSSPKAGNGHRSVVMQRQGASQGSSSKRIATSLSPKKQVKKPALMVSDLSVRSSGGQQQQQHGNRQQHGNQQNRHESDRGRQQQRGRPAVRYITCQAESMKYSRREISP